VLSIPGIGPLSAAIFLGEIGNPAHFQNARQIVKYAGYDPQESDSGYRISRKFISKKGRWLLRKGWSVTEEERDPLRSSNKVD